MIVWFNCKISDIRLNPQPRYNLRTDNRFDIARYSFASFKPLEPLVSKFIFNLEMADGHAGQEAEMEQWLRSIFPADKLSLHWYRCNNIAQWREIQAEMDEIGDDIVFPAGNEDHIFMDSDASVIESGLELLKNSTDPRTVIMTSHYPESIRAAYVLGGSQVGHHPNYVAYQMGNNDALRIMKRELFDWYLDQVRDPNAFIFRTEHWNNISLPQNIIMNPVKEQFRHFDGYAHVNASPDVAPPLEIPAGFFTGMKIRYGYADRKEGWVNINPLSAHLNASDPAGADYKFTLDDMPEFWSDYVTEVDVNPDLDHQAATEARDKYYIDLTQVNFNWHHVGVVFDNSNRPPLQWIQNHMVVTEFVEQ